MPRYRLLLEYDGGPYAGFQAQARQPSVQAALERAIAGFCGESVRVHAAGRTDAGVHATGQVAHIDLAKAWPADVVRDALNAHLGPEPIAVVEAAQVGEDFHARFSARARHYRYRIVNRRAPPALERGRAWHVKKPLDAAAMHAAAQALVGRHDFTTFRDAACQAKSPVKTLDVCRGDAGWGGGDAGLLRPLVPAPPGALDDRIAGRGRDRTLVGGGLQDGAEARDRAACGPVAPPDGLYLVGVDYEPNVEK